MQTNSITLVVGSTRDQLTHSHRHFFVNILQKTYSPVPVPSSSVKLLNSLASSITLKVLTGDLLSSLLESGIHKLLKSKNTKRGRNQIIGLTGFWLQIAECKNNQFR